MRTKFTVSSENIDLCISPAFLVFSILNDLNLEWILMGLLKDNEEMKNAVAPHSTTLKNNK